MTPDAMHASDPRNDGRHRLTGQRRPYTVEAFRASVCREHCSGRRSTSLETLPHPKSARAVRDREGTVDSRQTSTGSNAWVTCVDCVWSLAQPRGNVLGAINGADRL